MHTITPLGSDDFCRATPPHRDRLLKLEQVKEMVGLGKTLIYKLVQAGGFPAPYKPVETISRWSENEILEWLAACASQRLQ